MTGVTLSRVVSRVTCHTGHASLQHTKPRPRTVSCSRLPAEISMLDFFSSGFTLKRWLELLSLFHYPDSAVWAAVDRGRGEPVINSLLLYNTLHNLTRHHLIQFEITRIILSRERGTDLHFHNLSVPDKMKCRVIAPVFTRDGVRLRRGGHSPEKILAPIRRRPLLSSLCAPSKCDPMTGKYFTREKYLDVLEKISHL